LPDRVTSRMEYADITGNIFGDTGIASMLSTGVTPNTIMADSMSIMQASAVASTGVICVASTGVICAAATRSISVSTAGVM